MVKIDFVYEKAIELTMQYLPKVILAILTLIIGLILIRWIGNVADNGMKKKKVEVSLRKFLRSLIGIILKVLLLLSIASMLGIETTSFVAILAAAGLAIGLALQGSLANFAGGVLILLFKPFKVGDLLEAQGFLGTVEEIQIFNTLMKTPDNKVVVIPNGVLSNGPITNYSKEPIRRVDMKFGISYEDDYKKAQKILTEIVTKHKMVLKDPAPTVRVSELGDSSVNFVVRPWCKTEDYWTVFFDVTEAVKDNFDKSKVSIPYPQMDVHVKK